MKIGKGALLASGAAWVLGCAGAGDDKPAEPAPRSGLGGLVDGPRFDGRRPSGEMLSDEIGRTQQPYQVPVGVGWAVSSHLGTFGSPPRSTCIPDDLGFASLNDQTPGILGRCGGVPFNGHAQQCSDFSACIFPFSGADGFIRRYTWAFDATNCGVDSDQATRILNGIRDGMFVLSSNTGWTFAEELINPANARIDIRCATAAERNALGNAYGIFQPLGQLSPVGNGFTGASGQQGGPSTVLENCTSAGPGNHDSITFFGDVSYTYALAEVVINQPLMASDFAHCPPNSSGVPWDAASKAWVRNTYSALIQHEILHFLGFTHEFYSDNDFEFDNPIAPHLNCTAGDNHVQFAPRLRTAMANIDTHSPSASVGLFDADLSCLEPWYENARGSVITHSDSGQGSELNGGGVTARYTSNMTYGVQTGVAHLSCNWFNASQVCTMPTAKRIHWCFAPSVTDSQFKTDFRDFTGIDGAVLPTRTGGEFAGSTVYYGDFTFQYHSSCDDPEVTLVVDTNACSGTNSTNIDGYACLHYSAPSNAQNGLQLVDNTGFQAVGNYYGYDIDGWAVLSIDVNDIGTATLPAYTQPGGLLDGRTELFRHAVIAGLEWVIGIGSRTDTTVLFSSRSVAPLVKKIWIPQDYHDFRSGFDPQVLDKHLSFLNPGETCRAISFAEDLDGKFTLQSYCGAD